MKHKILSIAFAMAGVALLNSCADNWVNDLAEQQQGKLNTASILPTVNTVEDEKSEAPSVKAPASRAVTDLSAYLIEVVRQDGSVAANWTYSSMPALPTFPVGSYKVRVKSHNVEDVAWNAPYYVGEQDFQIREGAITDVDPITCKLGNVRVTLIFTDALKEAAGGGNDIKVTVTSNPGVSLDYTAFETRSGYFAHTDGLTTLKVRFTGTVNGIQEDFTRVLQDVAPGQHRKVTFALRTNPNLPEDETGNVIIPEGEGLNVDCGTETVDVDGNVTNIEEVGDDSDRPGKEDPEDPDDPDTPDNPDDPTDDPAKVITFKSEYLNLDGVNNVDEYGEGLKPAVVDIHSDNGVANLKVEIISDFLTDEFLKSVNLTSQFDLAYPGEYEAGLKGLQFPTGSDVIGAHDLQFDITQFVPLLFESGDHNFKITVVDSKKLSNTLLLRLRKN